MTGGPVADLLAVAMVGVACFHAGRVTLAFLWRRSTQVDVDVVHTAMGVSMVGMLTGWLSGAWNDAWTLVFAASTVWFGLGLFRRLSDARAAGPAIAHHLPHFIASAVMLYMLWAMRWTSVVGRQAGSTAVLGSMGQMGQMGHLGGASPFLPSVLAALVVGNAAVAAWTALSPSSRLASLAEVASGVSVQTTSAVGASAVGASAVGATAVGAVALGAPAGPQAVAVLGYRGAPACLLVMSVAMAYMVVAVHP